MTSPIKHNILVLLIHIDSEKLMIKKSLYKVTSSESVNFLDIFIGLYISNQGRKSMNLEQIKYGTCPFDQEEGILLTDIEELLPQTNSDGELQYYCLNGHHTFTLDENTKEDYR
jgi:hypothetical protein